MTNSRDLQTLTYSEDFLIACAVFRLLPEEVLANFIRLMNYDSFMLGSKDNTTSAANRVVTAYLQPLTVPRVIHKQYERIHKKCKKTLESIIKDQGLNPVSKTEKLKLTVDSFYHRITQRHNLSHRITLPDNRQLILNRSFVVLCFVQGIDPIGLLQYFMDHVSFARDFALNDLRESANDPFMWFVLNMAGEYFKERAELHDAGFYDQQKKMRDLLEAMKAEGDYEKRLAAFTQCLKGMYQALKDVPIEPCFLSELIE